MLGCRSLSPDNHIYITLYLYQRVRGLCSTPSGAEGCLLDKTETAWTSQPSLMVEFLLLILFPGCVCGRWRAASVFLGLLQKALHGAPCRRGRHTAVQHRFWKSCSMTEESASVETSPRSRSLRAILRSTRRMILPGGEGRGRKERGERREMKEGDESERE